MNTDAPAIRLSITSFMVPELSIDLPETATVANLKANFLQITVFCSMSFVPDGTKESKILSYFEKHPNLSKQCLMSNSLLLLILHSFSYREQ